MGLVNTTEVDGVPTFWVDSGRPTLSASLIFRAGIADEDMATTGWLHLLEHLSLHGLARGSLAVNGSVSMLYTSFVVHGPADQVVTTLAEITRRLVAPELAELDRERRVLAAEAATRGGPVHRALGQRYGARGPGLAAYDDAALGRATPELLREVAGWAFPAGNGVLALDGPPPAGLSLGLAPGGRIREVRDATPVEKPRSVYAEPAGLVLSGVISRAPGNTLVAPVVEDALRRKLRDQDGTSYAPYAVYEAVDNGSAVVVAGADVSPATAPSLLGNVLDLVGNLAEHGPDPEALADIKASGRQVYTDPYNIGFLAHRAAGEHLWGRPVQQLDELLAEHDAVDGSQLESALADLRDSLIVGAPPATAPHRRLEAIQQPVVRARTTGARSSNWPADDSVLGITDDMVTFGDRQVQYQFSMSDVAGYYRWDNGGRRLVLQDGWGFTLVPGAWSGGDRHQRRLDELVTDGLHLPQPPETAPEPVEPQPLARRWWLGMLRWFGGPIRAVIVLLALLWCLLGVVQGVGEGEYALSLVFVPIAFAVVWFFKVRRPE